MLVEIGIVFGFKGSLDPAPTEREKQVALSSGFVSDFYFAVSFRAYKIGSVKEGLEKSGWSGGEPASLVHICRSSHEQELALASFAARTVLERLLRTLDEPTISVGTGNTGPISIPTSIASANVYRCRRICRRPRTAWQGSMPSRLQTAVNLDQQAVEIDKVMRCTIMRSNARPTTIRGKARPIMAQAESSEPVLHCLLARFSNHVEILLFSNQSQGCICSSDPKPSQALGTRGRRRVCARPRPAVQVRPRRSASRSGIIFVAN